MTHDHPFSVGDVVMPKHHTFGPLMAVEGFDGTKAKCTWFVCGKLYRDLIDESLLIHVPIPVVDRLLGR